ncbi:MAG TPA: polysaccharide deacetylase [Gammaproteobacteria bacterium]|nr:polysaccharide deacetylase [Gammaproteobacteria bacterium]|tara:strand:+ start:4020 stop:4898 length:879 start_codon:yes stop_codon:yes gene_type:complete
MTFPKDRVPYSAIIDRPPLALPGGARMVIWTIVNVEEWDIERPMPRSVLSPPMGQPLMPDLPNWAWHEYGMRVGFWRLLDCLKRFDIPVTLAINGSVCATYPRVASAALEAGWEFMGHGFNQRPMHQIEDELEVINQTIEAIHSFTGRVPRGWESPGLTETFDTIDHLAAAGIEYVADWVLDDQPVDIATKDGSVLSIPYTVETNDITMIALQQHESREIFERTKAQFDQLYQESAEITRIMAISLHPYITGAPHRIGQLETFLSYLNDRPGVLMWTGEQILDWYRSQHPKQ